MYPLTYQDVIEKITQKQCGININAKFNKIKKKFQIEEICCKPRYLDPKKKNNCKYWYNSNFINKLIREYKSEVDKFG